MAMLREQCSNHAKERAALKTILDAKIKSLVNEISRSLGELPPAEVCTDQLCSCWRCHAGFMLGLPAMICLVCLRHSRLWHAGGAAPSLVAAGGSPQQASQRDCQRNERRTSIVDSTLARTAGKTLPISAALGPFPSLAPVRSTLPNHEIHPIPISWGCLDKT